MKVPGLDTIRALAHSSCQICGLTLIAMVSLVLSLPVQAQEERQDTRWYTVEMVIFSSSDPAGAVNEGWPRQPTLAYPPLRRFLHSGALEEAPAEHLELLTVEDTAPAHLDLLWDKTLSQLRSEWARKQAAALESSALANSDTEQLVPLAELRIPAAFVLLDAQSRQLGSERRRIDRSPSRQVLFHESWLQPMRERNQSDAIIIASPHAAGEYPALQGSVQLYAERFLHIRTNLWLNTSGGYMNTDWRMQPPPEPPLEVADPVLPFRVTLQPHWYSGSINAGQIATSTGIATGTAPLSAASAQSVVLIDPGTGDARVVAGTPYTAAQTYPTWDLRQIKTPLPAVVKPALDYNFAHAVVMQQNRKMRSGELHYLDHPLMGVLIKITPWYP
jgi:hypothetical protein